MSEKHCKHENADHLKPGDVFYPAYGTLGEFAVLVEQLRCIDCGAWLSLGPSNDMGCEVEIDAAEHAAVYRDQNARTGYDRFEWCPTTNSDELCDVCHTLELVSRIFDNTEGS